VGRDNDDDDVVTETNVELDPSIVDRIAEITITESSESPITVDSSISPETASPADTEPRTLAPRLLVRGLAPSAVTFPGSVPLRVASASDPLPTNAPLTKRPGSAPHDDDDDDKTTRSIDANVLDAFDAAKLGSRAPPERVSAPAPTMRSAIITPSEPYRTTSPGALELTQASSAAPTQPRRAPIPAAGRPPETDPDVSEPTQKRAPLSIGDVDLEDAEDETSTDMRSVILDPSLDEAETVDGSNGGALEEPYDETKTHKDVAVSVAAALESLPGATRELVGLEEARQARKPDGAPTGPGKSGATVKMFFTASPAPGTTRLTHGDGERLSGPAAQPSPLMATTAAQVTTTRGRAPTAQQIADALAAEALANAEPKKGKKRRSRRTRKVLVFVIAFGATAALVFYRHRLPLGFLKRPPFARAIATAPPAARPAPALTDTVDASAANATDAGALGAASASASASVSVPAPASASAGASARAQGRGRRPPKK
jgi:hypothetical protein